METNLKESNDVIDIITKSDEIEKSNTIPIDNIKIKSTIGEKIDSSISNINEFFNNTIIYVSDIYSMLTYFYDYIKNIIESIYIVKFKHPIKFD